MTSTSNSPFSLRKMITSGRSATWRPPMLVPSGPAANAWAGYGLRLCFTQSQFCCTSSLVIRRACAMSPNLCSPSSRRWSATIGLTCGGTSSPISAR